MIVRPRVSCGIEYAARLQIGILTSSYGYTQRQYLDGRYRLNRVRVAVLCKFS